MDESSVFRRFAASNMLIITTVIKTNANSRMLCWACFEGIRNLENFKVLDKIHTLFQIRVTLMFDLINKPDFILL